VNARFAVSGPLAGLQPAQRARLFERSTSADPEVREIVRRAIDRVRAEGDGALRAFARAYDGVELDAIEVPRAMRRAALAGLAPELRAALERAARNIATAHRAMAPRPVEVETEPGVVIGRRPDPLGRVGLYAPGGTATYPSSVLMGAIPARVAGVPEVVLCSPPARSGAPADVLLAAAEIAGVDRVFAAGGAGAIAAMALGTATVPRVDRIVGPGGAFVTEAKIQLAGVVSFDAPAGPSELLAIVGPGADLAAVAADAIAQAEHDPRAAVAVIVAGAGSEAIAARLGAAIAAGADATPRAAIVRRALESAGALLWTGAREAALAFAAAYAPEHLLLAVAEPEAWLPEVRHAGTVYLGAHASPVFGDYMTGANHTLPTGGLARSWSGLSTLDFVRWTTWQRIAPDAAARMAPDVARLADAEGLPGHAAAARAAMEVT
jgi:histidinol dehydrogenase